MVMNSWLGFFFHRAINSNPVATTSLDHGSNLRELCEVITPSCLNGVGHGSLVVKVTKSWLTCYELNPSAAEDSPCRGGQCMLNMMRLKRPSVGMVCQFRSRSRHLTMVQNYEVHRQNALE
ncbi:hypothetical protein TNCV_2559791 [Trichonephila clavipes]|nr:hypothetical protein TNCV_2559791 [Trichonephila clavipes]